MPYSRSVCKLFYHQSQANGNEKRIRLSYFLQIGSGLVKFLLKGSGRVWPIALSLPGFGLRMASARAALQPLMPHRDGKPTLEPRSWFAEAEALGDHALAFPRPSAVTKLARASPPCRINFGRAFSVMPERSLLDLEPEPSPLVNITHCRSCPRDGVLHSRDPK